MKSSLLQIVLWTLVILSLLSLIVYCSSSITSSQLAYDLSLQIFTGLILALSVLLIDKSWDEGKKKRNKIEDLTHKQLVFENLLENLFRRNKSNWNFRNLGPSFYFDNGWANSLADLLAQNNREWEIHLEEYQLLQSDKKSIIMTLISFMRKMQTSLVNAENLDTKLRMSYLGPRLAAGNQSSYKGDRDSAHAQSDLEFLVYRAVWAGADTTQILFGLSLYISQQLDISKIESLKREAETLANDKEFTALINTIKSDQADLLGIVTKVNKFA